MGHAADVAAPGSYLAAEIVGEPCAIVRGNDGVLRAFSNVCRHRASTILEGTGCAKSLRCPYHGWTYSLDGALLVNDGTGVRRVVAGEVLYAAGR